MVCDLDASHNLTNVTNLTFVLENERDFKASNAHWSVIVNYMEGHRELLTNKFNHVDGDNLRNKKHWEELTNNLNGLGYGCKSGDKWQLVSTSTTLVT